ncbi:MAG: hypothetical protein P8X74_10580 [Reinekea sp.]|jgi:hypothetical protein
MRVKTADAVDQKTAEDILNHRGALILPKGILLSEALVSALLKQNIDEVEIEEEVRQEKKAESFDTGLINVEMKAHIDQLFIRHRGPFMKEFQECLLQHLKKTS